MNSSSKQLVIRHFRFKMVLFILVVTSFCYGQKEYLKNYNSLKDWNSSEDEIAHVLDKYYRGGTKEFCKFLGKNIKYPEIASKNCKAAILLLKINLYKNKQVFTLENKVGFGFEESLYSAIDKISF